MNRLIAITAAAILALAPQTASAVDFGKLGKRLLDCDGPGMALVDRFAPESFGTQETEAQGFAVLELVALMIDEDPETMTGFAKRELAAVKTAATAKAGDMIERCKIENGAVVSVGNPIR